MIARQEMAGLLSLSINKNDKNFFFQAAVEEIHFYGTLALDCYKTITPL
jgi:hypothetical protein